MGRSFLIVLLAALLAFVGLEAKSVKRERIQSDLHSSFARAQWRFFDKRYEVIPQERFLNEFLPSFGQYLRERGIRGVTSGFGAKQYAEVFKIQLADWMRREIHKAGQPACGIALTNPSYLSGRSTMPSAWILVNLDGNWAVVNPVNLGAVWLTAFEHAGTISAVQF